MNNDQSNITEEYLEYIQLRHDLQYKEMSPEERKQLRAKVGQLSIHLNSNYGIYPTK